MTTCPHCGDVQEPLRQGSTPCLSVDSHSLQDRQPARSVASTRMACISVEDHPCEGSEAMRTREEAERRAQEIAQAYKAASKVTNKRKTFGLKLGSLIFALGIGLIYWVTLGSVIWSLCHENASTTLYGLISNFIVLPCIVFFVYRVLYFVLKLVLLRRF
jgi:hypothetical protein